MISVVVPAYNEERQIGNTLLKMLRIKEIDEIIVVDDGSKDKTCEIVKEISFKNKKIQLLIHSMNKGKGCAMRTGVNSANGNIIVFIDASQFNPNDIPKLIKKLNGFNMVIGVRNFKSIPFLRKINNFLSRFAVFLGTGKRIGDSITGFRAIRKKDFLSLNTKEKGYTIEIEITFKAIIKGFKIAEVPIHVNYKGEDSLPTLTNLKRFVYESIFTCKLVLKSWFKLWD